MLKKSLSALLAIIMIFGMISMFPVSGFAQEAEIAKEGADMDFTETGYTAHTQAEAVQWARNMADNHTYCGQCVALIQKYYTWLGVSVPNTNANTYANTDHIPPGWYVDNTPSLGAVYVVANDSPGHVCIVVGIDSAGTLTTVDSNVTGTSVGQYNAQYYPWTTGRKRSDYAGVSGKYFVHPDFPDPTPQGHVMSESEAAGRTIPDGTYWICSKIAQDYFWDIPGDNRDTANGNNLQMWIRRNSPTPGEYDAFYVQYIDNGFYIIVQKGTQMAVDVKGCSLDRGTNVQMWEVNYSYAQQWSIEKTDSGYKLRSRCNNYYADVYNANYAGETNIQTWEGNDTNAQRFSFIPYNPDERPISDGVYSINSIVGDACFMDVSGEPGYYTDKSNVQIWNGSDELFSVEYDGDGFYRICEVTSGLPVEVTNDDKSYLDNSRNVALGTKSGSRGQFWKIRKNTDGTYSFINKQSGYYLDVNNGGSADGTNIKLYPYNGSNAQKWQIKKIIRDNMVKITKWSMSGGFMKPDTMVAYCGQTLIKNEDYMVSTYIDGEKLYAKITGAGEYSGTVSVEYKQLAFLGDADNDGEITILDVTLIQRKLVSLPVPNFNEKAADIDGDGLSITDATLIQRRLAGLKTPYPIGEAIST